LNGDPGTCEKVFGVHDGLGWLGWLAGLAERAGWLAGLLSFRVTRLIKFSQYL